jgi:hypothetical protein
MRQTAPGADTPHPLPRYPPWARATSGVNPQPIRPRPPHRSQPPRYAARSSSGGGSSRASCSCWYSELQPRSQCSSCAVGTRRRRHPSPSRPPPRRPGPEKAVLRRRLRRPRRAPPQRRRQPRHRPALPPPSPCPRARSSGWARATRRWSRSSSRLWRRPATTPARPTVPSVKGPRRPSSHSSRRKASPPTVLSAPRPRPH